MEKALSGMFTQTEKTWLLCRLVLTYGCLVYLYWVVLTQKGNPVEETVYGDLTHCLFNSFKMAKSYSGMESRKCSVVVANLKWAAADGLSGTGTGNYFHILQSALSCSEWYNKINLSHLKSITAMHFSVTTPFRYRKSLNLNGCFYYRMIMID